MPPSNPALNIEYPTAVLRTPLRILLCMSKTISLLFCCSAVIRSDHLLIAHPVNKNINAVLTRPNKLVNFLFTREAESSKADCVFCSISLSFPLLTFCSSNLLCFSCSCKSICSCAAVSF